MNVRALLLASAALAASAGMASAADIYVPPPVAPVVVPAPAPLIWSGAYVGAHAGYIWGDSEWSLSRESGGADVTGLIGGLLAGYNFEYNRIVFGAEADFGISNANGSDQFRFEDADDTSLDHDLEWNAHLRARVGLPMGRFMPFVAGGLAVANLNVTGPIEYGGTYTGFTIGGGVDVKFSDRLMGRAEILYDDYGNKSFDKGLETSLTGTTVRGALIFHLPHY